MIERLLKIYASVTIILPSPPSFLSCWGEEDRWHLLESAYRFKRDVPHAVLKIYQGAGHVPMKESPDETMKDLEIFLKDLA